MEHNRPEESAERLKTLSNPLSRVFPSPKLNKIFILFNYVCERKRCECGTSLFFSFTAVSVNVYSTNGVMKNHICSEKQKDIVCESILLQRDKH